MESMDEGSSIAHIHVSSTIHEEEGDATGSDGHHHEMHAGHHMHWQKDTLQVDVSVSDAHAAASL
jgi:hypothetical protein